MDMKYTLEILTKDIQDIEKLVGNLQNSPGGSTLELDLALSKLRNVYDILTVIRADMDLSGKQQEAEAARQVESRKPEKVKKEEPVNEVATVVTAEEPEAEEEPAGTEHEPVVEEEPVTKKEPVSDHPPVKSPETIAEKFATESSINENLAGTRDSEMDSKLIGQTIDNISRNIGINDRFLIIRELFDGDAENFGKLLDKLDQAGDLQSANKLLEKQFGESPEHDGITILTNLLKRRYNGK